MGIRSRMFVGIDEKNKLFLPLDLILRKYKLVASGSCLKAKPAQKKN
jgi:hypothetical protein